jgi:hypothetical protein
MAKRALAKTRMKSVKDLDPRNPGTVRGGGSGDPLKGLNVSKHATGCQISPCTCRGF